MTILVSGASGHLGRLILNSLIARGVPTPELVAGARSPQRLDDLRTRGIRTVAFDYDDPTTLRAGLEGIDRFVLVSVSQPDTPVTQHDAVIAAAAAADLQALAYTSVYRASESALPLAPIHAAAERAIAATSIPAVILRNNSYTELYLGPLMQARQTGVIAAAAGNGRIAGATRLDLADAAAAAILDDSYLGQVLELSGDTAFSYADIAAAATEIFGRPVTYRALTVEQLREGLTAAGLDAHTVGVLTRLDAAIAAGDLDSTDRTLGRMIGRPTTTLHDVLRAGSDSPAGSATNTKDIP
ncbi:NAD(P)H-binding protein (plasmid) [Rhodococcus sp. USK10]|uniref:NAD(P)H-binding protein n=1 Tax=Rhodococcus sp. USK10 TaxID=2789739 RepID=UPI001C5E9668|nr:NAD(P)H-binding protein [Rhodococcus sp. USK10]QYA99794.1 NAD(P)H-binding protein [Rhodococcus sp. USK10]